MQYQQVSAWTIAYNSNGSLIVAPIMVCYEKQAFSPSLSKTLQNIYEVASSCAAVIYLVDREQFSNMDHNGNLKISPVCFIKNFIVYCNDICAAYAFLDLLKK